MIEGEEDKKFILWNYSLSVYLIKMLVIIILSYISSTKLYLLTISYQFPVNWACLRIADVSVRTHGTRVYNIQQSTDSNEVVEVSEEGDDKNQLKIPEHPEELVRTILSKLIHLMEGETNVKCDFMAVTCIKCYFTGMTSVKCCFICNIKCFFFHGCSRF